jgi:hypothetical protein
MQIEVIHKRFEQPAETRIIALGKFETVHLGGVTIGRATYQPGWKWSAHVGPDARKSLHSSNYLPDRSWRFSERRIYGIRSLLPWNGK